MSPSVPPEGEAVPDVIGRATGSMTSDDVISDRLPDALISGFLRAIVRLTLLVVAAQTRSPWR